MKNNKLLVLGAGFSKAMAGVPLVNEVLPKILDKNFLDEHESVLRKNCIDSLKEVITIIDNLLCKKNNPPPNHKEFFTIKENIELLLTYMDLALGKDTHKNGVDIPIHSFLLLQDIGRSKLKNAKAGLLTSLSLILYNYKLKSDIENLFDKWFDSILNNSNELNILTFNYDLIIDDYLFRKKIFNPKDGYFIEVQNYNKDIDYNSIVKILKIHGSINWNSEYGGKLGLFDHKSNEENFYDDSRIIYGGDKNKFEGLILSLIITPTFIKEFNSFIHYKLIKYAKALINNADEIYIIGYSFPQEDYIAVNLFNFEDSVKDKIVKIINPDIQNKDLLKVLFNKNKIEFIEENFFIEKKFEVYLKEEVDRLSKL